MPLTTYRSRKPSLSRSPNCADQLQPVASTPTSSARSAKRSPAALSASEKNTLAVTCTPSLGCRWAVSAQNGRQASSTDSLRFTGFMSVASSSLVPSLSMSPSAKLMVLVGVRLNGSARVQPSGVFRNTSSGGAKSLPIRMSRRPSPSRSVSCIASACERRPRRSKVSSPLPSLS